MDGFRLNLSFLTVEEKLGLGRTIPSLIQEKFGEGSVFDHTASKVTSRTAVLESATRPFSTVELTEIIQDFGPRRP